MIYMIFNFKLIFFSFFFTTRDFFNNIFDDLTEFVIQVVILVIITIIVLFLIYSKKNFFNIEDNQVMVRDCGSRNIVGYMDGPSLPNPNDGIIRRMVNNIRNVSSDIIDYVSEHKTVFIFGVAFIVCSTVFVFCLNQDYISYQSYKAIQKYISFKDLYHPYQSIFIRKERLLVFFPDIIFYYSNSNNNIDRAFNLLDLDNFFADYKKYLILKNKQSLLNDNLNLIKNTKDIILDEDVQFYEKVKKKDDIKAFFLLERITKLFTEQLFELFLKENSLEFELDLVKGISLVDENLFVENDELRNYYINILLDFLYKKVVINYTSSILFNPNIPDYELTKYLKYISDLKMFKSNFDSDKIKQYSFFVELSKIPRDSYKMNFLIIDQTSEPVLFETVKKTITDFNLIFLNELKQKLIFNDKALENLFDITADALKKMELYRKKRSELYLDLESIYSKIAPHVKNLHFIDFSFLINDDPVLRDSFFKFENGIYQLLTKEEFLKNEMLIFDTVFAEHISDLQANVLKINRIRFLKNVDTGLYALQDLKNLNERILCLVEENNIQKAKPF